MTFKPKFSNSSYRNISIDNFIYKFKINNPNTDLSTLKKGLLNFKQLKENGERCVCGNEIWIIGSAIAGKGCFTCITGDTDQTDDYEVE